MGGSVRASTGRNVAGLRVSPSEVSLFTLGTPHEVSGQSVSEVADHLGACLSAERFTVTTRALPFESGANPLYQPSQGTGMLVADRDVSPNPRYNQLTAWSVGGLLLLWVGASVVALVFARDWWLQTAILGSFFLAIPAWVISSYRGLGFTSLVAVVRLDPLPEVSRLGGEPVSAPHLRITIGVGRVESRQSMGRTLGRRRIVSVGSGAEVIAALRAISTRSWPDGMAPSAGLGPTAT
jgi:hypothetical protein